MREYALSSGVTLVRYANSGELDLSRWNDLANLPPWLRPSWLAGFAHAMRPASSAEVGVETEYLAFERGGRLCGVSLLQHLPAARMKLGERLPAGLGSAVLGARWHQFGQVLFSGAGGVHFPSDLAPGQVLAEARCVLREATPGDSVWLAKDLEAPVELEGWRALEVLPEMRMELPVGWEGSFENYLFALPSKYRRRVRRTQRQFAGLESRTLTEQEVAVYGAQVDALYRALLDRSPYVPFRAPGGYFVRLKQSLRERVVLRGYFDGARLVGFSTLLADRHEALAHFAAVDPRYNQSHNLYLNVLFDLLGSALAAGARRINFGRTATTIKSSLGALPVEQYSYVTHDGWLRNRALGVLSRQVLRAQPAELIQRPFGDSSRP